MGGNVSLFPVPGAPGQVGFDREELGRILDLYGRMVAAGLWRDYAMDLGRDAAVFSAFRRATERPEYRIEKRPALRRKQGQWALVGEGGAVLKRGHELSGVLAPLERKLVRVVD
ncbi:MAG: hypothetical protein A2792_06105 [Sphingomonadales bacterium RIFCSPHIGHO2_01_FULL_65_20]|uniref:DUF2794 domain-containing protein n=1 Tax=Sphingomonas ursincola TaxID=56361 RepID=A0A7V8RFW6_9SPHN|nr:DUF2794 domain-containing protein [Sphingomonas ursincola]MBA1375632.1 DUF2794 domain-containing protein [Sphingomonas ursincola]MBA4779894.1 DUF2794 domain-containing protein [Blastomonas sp.]MBY0618410.1 DUF2794 domain-containing protein [Sphingomonas ursincola]OHC95126.1 MAG: hypothetical protein A2792_06105 [Sphingomonadales bacterium RIFCSPHIGHO2_01_FULL_65_20]